MSDYHKCRREVTELFASRLAYPLNDKSVQNTPVLLGTSRCTFAYFLTMVM
jgi:hypothetical protein